MNAIEEKRLRKLEHYLRTSVPKPRFRMRQWFTGTFCGRRDEHLHNECGTSACALGWATIIFKRSGLRRLHTEWDQPITYKGHYYFRAAEAFFGITPSESIYIFGAPNANCPIKAADRIARVIKRRYKATESLKLLI